MASFRVFLAKMTHCVCVIFLQQMASSIDLLCNKLQGWLMHPIARLNRFFDEFRIKLCSIDTKYLTI